MRILLEIDNPSKLELLQAILKEFEFVRKVEVVVDENSTDKSRAASLARIMKGTNLPSYGDGLAFQKEARKDRKLPFRD